MISRYNQSLRAAFLGLALILGAAAALSAKTASPPKSNTLKFSPSEHVYIQVSDGLMLFGEYRAPKKKSAPVLVLLHGLGSSHGEWRPLVEAAARRGWGSLGIDLRGHGESQNKGSETVYYKDSPYAQNALFWQGMITDLMDAAHWMEKRKEIAPSRLVLVGASVGANICLNAAVSMKEVSAIVLLSPGYNYAEITTVPAMKDWRGPALFIASKPDAYAAQSVKLLQQASRSPEKLTAWIFDKSGPQGAHGVQLFNGTLEDKILDWIGKAYASK